MANWTTKDIPSQAGRSAIVTGTGGLGYEDALALARAGSDVIIAGRSADKGKEAVAKVQAEAPGSSIHFEQVDLGNLKSIEAFGERLQGQRDSLDLLINNAGVMTPPDRRTTSDGFELQFGTNYLGHYALTAQLMPLLRKGKNARVISLGSVAARNGQIDFDNLNAEKSYQPMPIYSQSKLACVMFGLELQRRSEANGWGITSIAAHPGVSRTDLLHNAPGTRSLSGMARTYLWFLFQPSAQGALPTLYAATSPEAKGGHYYGPNKLGETRGYPAEAKIPPQGLNEDVAARLWEVSAKMAGMEPK